MTQAQAVKETIRRLGGIATLKDIYKHIHKIKDCQWKTLTPDATVRRIVQKDKEIIRLKPGLYMLAEFQSKISPTLPTIVQISNSIVHIDNIH